MPTNFDEPIDEGLRVLADCGDFVIQVAKQGEVTDYKNGKDSYTAAPEDEILTYQFIKVERSLAHAGGDEYIDDIFSKCTNGRLYKKLRKLVKTWEGQGSIASQLYDIATDKNGYCTAKEEPQEFQVFLTKFKILQAAVEIECKKALELRRKIRDDMDGDFFGRETLYPLVVQNQGVVCDVRSLLKFVERDSLHGSDGRTRSDQIWEVQKVLEGLPGVSTPQDLDQAVCVLIGAVSPDSCDAESIKSAMRSCGDDRIKEGDENYDDAVMDACIMYGSYAPLEECFFLDERDGITWALKQFKTSQVLLGFQLDRTCNRIGASGWDFLRGDPTGRKGKLVNGQ